METTAGSAVPTTEISTVSEVELEATAAVKDGSKSSSGAYIAQKRGKKYGRVKSCLLKRSCFVYTLIIAFVWVVHATPIIIFLSINSKFIADNSSSVSKNDITEGKCSDDFYLDNSSGVCRPECGEWDQYSPDTRSAVYGINITFALVTVIVCAVTIVWSVLRHKIMLHYPNIILVYISFTRILLSVLNLVGYTDEKALYCTSRDRSASFEEGSPYCNIIGSATTFVPTFELIGLCFHLGTVLFTAYSPFRARQLETKGGYKYLHIVAVSCAICFSGFFVGVQFAVGGYSRTVVPIYCLASPEGAFVFAVVPVCISSATFLTFVMILLFKIIDIDGLNLKIIKKKNNKAAKQNSSLSNRHTSAQIKLILIFCTYGLGTIINFSAYSVVLRQEGPFSQALEEYLDCESLGTNSTCSRDKFENFDPTPITNPLALISYVLLPVSTLIYVANVEKIFKMCKTKLTRSSL